MCVHACMRPSLRLLKSVNMKPSLYEMDITLVTIYKVNSTVKGALPAECSVIRVLCVEYVGMVKYKTKSTVYIYGIY